MNRTLESALRLLSVATSGVAAIVAVWAWREGLFVQGDLRQRLAPGLIAFVPALMWGLLVWAPPKLATARPRLSDDHRSHLQGALGFWFIALAAIQGWVAYNYLRLGPPPLEPETFARLAFVLMGVAMAVRGNFVAKLAPPVGDGAPDEAAWTRSMLRTGWAMALIGIAMLIGAMVLPVRMLALSAFVVAPALVAVSLAHRRATRTPQR